MRKSEKGITLLSLVVTIVVMSILAGVLVGISYKANPIVNSVKNENKTFIQEKTNTEKHINEMTRGWEDII